MRHAFVVLAHRQPWTLSRLLEQLDDERCEVLLHVDPRSPDLRPSDVSGVLRSARLHVLPPRPVNWAGYSLVATTVRALAAAARLDVDYVHLLSGADLLLRPFPELDAFVAAHQGREFIDFAPHHYAFARYKAAHVHPLVDTRPFRRSRAVRALNHGVARVQQAARLTRTSTPLYHGSAFFSITCELAAELGRREQEIARRFRWTLAADEVFVQTLAIELGVRDRVHRFEEPMVGNLRLIDWARREGNSPRTFTSHDTELLLAPPEGVFFARKFDETVDPQVIERVHGHVTSSA